MHRLGPPLVRSILIMVSFLYMSDSRASYYITAPTYILPGVNTTLAVHLFGTNYTELNVTAEIREKSKVLVNVRHVFTNNSIGLLSIPALPLNTSSSSYELSVNGSIQDVLVFSTKTYLPRQKTNVSVFIQTDKVVYKPGQKIEIRVISVYTDLKPYKGLVDLAVMDPENNIVQQWMNLATDLGVVSAEILLSKSPMLGSWRIQVMVNNAEVTSFFSVFDYVAPKYEVTIKVPGIYVEPKHLNLIGTVTAENIFGNPIKGNVTVSVKPLYYNVYESNINKTFAITGSANFSFTYEELSDFLNWGGINITASVTEDLTGIVVQASSNVEKRDSDYKLVIVSEPRVTTPGLNFTAKMQILRYDNASLIQEERDKIVTITIIQSTTKYWTAESNLTPISNSDSVIMQQHTIPESGMINIEFTVIPSIQLIKIEAQYQDTTQNWILDKSAELNISANIRTSNSTKKVGEAFQVDVNTQPGAKELYYVVISKGAIVAAGKKTNASFTLTPEQSWAPHSTLIVYFIYFNGNNNEIIQSSELLYIKDVFKNKVSLSWSKNKVQPSENISLTVHVQESRSLVGLRVVESGATDSGNDLTAFRVENDIVAYTQGLGNDLSDSPISYISMPTDELVLLLRGEWESMGANPPQPIKKFSPDTWFWLLTNISSGSTANIEVTAPRRNSSWVASAFVISEELGLGLTEEPVQLEVSQPFFFLLNLPYSVVRGEEFILEVTLFNYFDENLQAMVTLEGSNSFEIIVPNNDVSIVSGYMNVTVPNQGTKTILFPIKPKQLGQISITVKAFSSSTTYTETQTIFVKAEGIKHFNSQSALFEVIANQSVSKNFSFTFPSDLVPGSEEVFVTVVGDLIGPSIHGLESLILMPYGCGEQNMINFAPDIFILYYLIVTQQITENTRNNIIVFLEQGYQSELTYLRDDGSFSAFGNRDISGSTWLSAYVLKCFLQARPFIYVSQAVLNQTAQWLVQYQDMNTGIFSEPGRVIHTELQGGLNSPIALTAYILTSLLEDEVYRNLYASRILKSVQYLESKFDEGISSNYTLSVVTYTLSLANSTKANAALTHLNSRANNIGGLKYWSTSSTITNVWQPRSSDIETAAYALLSHYKQNRISEGIPIMKWISQQRNHLGGYLSSQDTVMALQALALFMTVAPSGDTSLTLTVTGPGSFVPKTFQVNNDNLLVLQSQQINGSQPLSINADAVGRGLALFQLNINYNRKANSRRKRNTLMPEAFSLDVAVNEDKNNVQRLTVEVCTSYQGAEYETGMALLEVGCLSGFKLIPELIPINGSLKMVEENNDTVHLYFDSINKTNLCVSIPMVRVANVAGSQDAVVKITDYYNPSNVATTTYNSETMKNISTCDFCGFNCTLCKSNVRVKPLASSATAPSFYLFGVFMFSFYYILRDLPSPVTTPTELRWKLLSRVISVDVDDNFSPEEAHAQAGEMHRDYFLEVWNLGQT
ncbi:CD109 antigen-like [Pelodytes ibericus]